MTKKTQIVNRWQELHEFLEKQSKPNEKSKATDLKEKICYVNGWSNSTYYRMMKNPHALSRSEKATIANIYDMPIHFLFPEMETETA